MDVGTEWLVDALGCRGDCLADIGFLRGFCAEIIAALDLHVVGQPQWRQFPPPGGITALCLLTESHLSLHTYPEKGIATINLYCCRPRPAWNWEGRLRDLLGARQVVIRRIVRGMHDNSGQSKERPVSDLLASGVIEPVEAGP
jgi:S-adenosylmethionine decarboxylase